MTFSDSISEIAFSTTEFGTQKGNQYIVALSDNLVRRETLTGISSNVKSPLLEVTKVLHDQVI